MTTIADSLDAIKCQGWQHALDELMANYFGIEEHLDEPSHAFLSELLDTLGNLADYQGDVPVVRLFIRQLSNFTSFSYRVRSSTAQYWNPLEEPFKAFTRKHPDYEVFRGDAPFPSADIIRDWAAKRLVS